MIPSALRLLLAVLTLLSVALPAEAQTEPAFVDLTVSVRSYGPKNIVQGDAIRISGAETNLGTGFAEPPFDIAYGLTPDANVGDDNDLELGRTTETEGLFPGETFSAEVTMHVPLNVPVGPYHLGAYISPGEEGPEEPDYANNAWVSSRADIVVREAILEATAARSLVDLGAAASFTATPNGNPYQPSFQWERRLPGGSFVSLENDSFYAGVSSRTLRILETRREDFAAQFRCRMSTPAPGSFIHSNTTGITLKKKPQKITFRPASRVFLRDAPFSLFASSDSGLPVTLELLSGPGTLAGNVLFPSATGSFVVAASQEGDDAYLRASTVFATIEVVLVPQTISFSPPRQLGDFRRQVVLMATASSGLPVSFALISGPGEIVGDVLTFLAAGTVVVEATQPGDIHYEPAPPVRASITLPLIPQTIQFSLLRTATYGDAPLPLAATASSGLPVGYRIFGPAAFAGFGIEFTGAGSVVVQAFQLGDDFHAPAPVQVRRIQVGKKTLTVRADDASRLVGRANPFIPLRYEGFVGGDSAADLDKPPRALSSAKLDSSPGRYPIRLFGGSDNNYAFQADSPLAHLTLFGFGGIYETLLFDADEEVVGKLSLKVAENSLAYTGVLDLASEPAPLGFRGRLAATGGEIAFGEWSRDTPAPARTLTFSLSGDSLVAQYRVGNLLRSSGTGARGFTQPSAGGRKLSAPWTGAHTLVFRDPVPLEPPPGSLSSASGLFPRGFGFAAAPVAASGLMNLKGKLGDGSSLTATVRPDISGKLRVFARPYGRRTESILGGTLALVSHPESSRFPGRYYVPATAGISWRKAQSPASPLDKSYRAGFAVELVALLDPWLPPSAKPSTLAPVIPAGTLAQRLGLASAPTASAALSLAFGTDELELDLGASAELLPTQLTLSAKGTVSVTEPGTTPINATNFSLKVTAATGLFSGGFTLRDTVPGAAKPTLRKVTFAGALRQAPTAAEDSGPLGHAHFLFDPVVGDTGPDSTEQISAELRLEAPAE